MIKYGIIDVRAKINDKDSFAINILAGALKLNVLEIRNKAIGLLTSSSNSNFEDSGLVQVGNIKGKRENQTQKQDGIFQKNCRSRMPCRRLYRADLPLDRSGCYCSRHASYLLFSDRLQRRRQEHDRGLSESRP